jgi:hypothetical protein
MGNVYSRLHCSYKSAIPRSDACVQEKTSCEIPRSGTLVKIFFNNFIGSGGIVFHVYSIVSYKHERALIQKALDECVVINKQYLDALRDTNPYFSEMTDPIVNKCLDEKIKF